MAWRASVLGEPLAAMGFTPEQCTNAVYACSKGRQIDVEQCVMWILSEQAPPKVLHPRVQNLYYYILHTHRHQSISPDTACALIPLRLQAELDISVELKKILACEAKGHAMEDVRQMLTNHGGNVDTACASFGVY